MQVLKQRKWDRQLFKDAVSGVPWEEAVRRYYERLFDGLCGPWGRYP